MSEVEWDAENFEPNVGKPVVVIPAGADKWDGEDDDEDIRDNWDDDDAEKEEKPTDGAGSTAVQVPKKKRPLKERLLEKEERVKKELEEKRKREETNKKTMTPKELHEENKRRQKEQEEADLALAIDAFGLTRNDRAPGVIDGFEPSTKEEFEKFSEMLSSKITKFEKSPHYEPFLESLYQKLALGLEAESIRKLSSMLTTLQNEKVKQTKGTKGKKKSQKASLVVGKDTEVVKEDDAIYDEFDDYL